MARSDDEGGLNEKRAPPDGGGKTLGQVAFEAFTQVWRTPGIRADIHTQHKAWQAAAEAVQIASRSAGCVLANAYMKERAIIEAAKALERVWREEKERPWEPKAYERVLAGTANVAKAVDALEAAEATPTD